MTIWKKINGFEMYEISSKGQVRRIAYDKNDYANSKKFELPFYNRTRLDKDGYETCTLCVNGKNYERRIHRLVAINFIENPLNKKEVNHINGIKNDNRVENLEWVTQSENRQHCLKNLNPKLRNNKLSKKVYQYDLNGNLINIFPSAKEAHRTLKISQGHISEVCRGEKMSYKGYVWKYEEVCNDYPERE